MIGEIRDRETMQQALLHTLTGHLCLSTLHANNSYHALSRIINMFPYDARSGVLSDLSIGLRAIVSQRLVRNKDGEQQPAVEILLNTSLIAELDQERRDHADQGGDGAVALSRDRRRSSRRCAASTSTAQISYDEAMVASDSPTNLAWLINQNTPTRARRRHGEARRRTGDAGAAQHSDFAAMTIEPDMLDRALTLHGRRRGARGAICYHWRMASAAPAATARRSRARADRAPLADAGRRRLPGAARRAPRAARLPLRDARRPTA